MKRLTDEFVNFVPITVMRCFKFAIISAIEFWTPEAIYGWVINASNLFIICQECCTEPKIGFNVLSRLTHFALYLQHHVCAALDADRKLDSFSISRKSAMGKNLKGERSATFKKKQLAGRPAG